MDPQQLRTMIDACRPGSHDLHAPEMAALADHLARDPQARELYERSQRLDAALGAAFRDVPIPGGLEQRLLAAVGVTAPEAESAVHAEPAGKHTQVERAPRAGGFSRRRMAMMVAFAACVIFGFIGGYAYFNVPSEITRSSVVASTQATLNDQDFGNPAAWNSMKSPPHRTVPSSVAAGPSGWRRIDTDLGKGVAFRIPVRRGQDAYLFVMDAEGSQVGIGAVPPRAPFPEGTGGWKIGAWSSNGFLYVLAIQGDDRDYSRLLHRPPTA